MKYLLIILLIGCSAIPEDTQMLHKALSNFTYKADSHEGLWNRFDSIDKPFAGDCEDFAFTLQLQIGGKVMYTKRWYGPHAVLLKDGLVYDNEINWPVATGDYGSELLYEMVYSKKPY